MYPSNAELFTPQLYHTHTFTPCWIVHPLLHRHTHTHPHTHTLVGLMLISIIISSLPGDNRSRVLNSLLYIYPVSQNSTYALVGIFGGEFPPINMLRLSLSNIRIQGVYTGSKGYLEELFNLWIDKKVTGLFYRLTSQTMCVVGDVWGYLFVFIFYSFNEGSVYFFHALTLIFYTIQRSFLVYLVLRFTQL